MHPIEARQYARYLRETYVPQVKREEPVTALNCHTKNRYGAVNKHVHEEFNGDVVVTMDTVAHHQMWIFSASGELVTAVTYVDFGADVPATRRESALEHIERRHTA